MMEYFDLVQDNTVEVSTSVAEETATVDMTNTNSLIYTPQNNYT